MSGDPFGDAGNVAARCLGKTRFANPTLAWRIKGRRIPGSRRAAKAGRSVYRCPHCGGWHVGRSRR